jgi:hypothetical protein
VQSSEALPQVVRVTALVAIGYLLVTIAVSFFTK